jgi:putative hydrolase of the HAD superfamily
VRDPTAQNLLIDADDTLWENNIYYERVIQEAVALLDGAGVDSCAFRTALDEAERLRIPLQGYGTMNFTQSLVETFKMFQPPDADPSLSERIQNLSLAILDHPMELLDTVPDTLAYLSSRHALHLVTKGNREEQSRKVRDSNLQIFFQSVEILPEKDTLAFGLLLDQHGWERSCTWMIGNSPRSDINPALAVGMNAVYIPHKHTWTFEQEHPMDHPKLIMLERFSDLRLHF